MKTLGQRRDACTSRFCGGRKCGALKEVPSRLTARAGLPFGASIPQGAGRLAQYDGASGLLRDVDSLPGCGGGRGGRRMRAHHLFADVVDHIHQVQAAIDRDGFSASLLQPTQIAIRVID